MVGPLIALGADSNRVIAMPVRKPPRWLPLALVVTLVPGPLAGQWNGERPPPTTAACQAVSAALHATPLPTASDSAWYVVPGCSNGGAAFAAALAALAGSSDTALFAQVIETARNFRDVRAFEAFRNLARNSGATTLARGVGFYGLIVAHNNHVVLDQPITTVLGPMHEPCGRDYAMLELPIVGIPLPSHYRSIIGAAARAVALNSNENPQVRAAARCADAFVRPSLPPEIVASKVALEYVCGNTFVVGNTNPDGGVFTFTVNGAPSDYKLEVGPGKNVKFGTLSPGTVRLYYNGTLFETTENGGTPCS